MGAPSTNIFKIGIFGYLLLVAFDAWAVPYDVLSIYLNTPPTNQLSLRIDLSDKDGDAQFEHFESLTLIRSSRIDVFTIADVDLTFSGTFRTDTDPNKLLSPGIGMVKSFTQSDPGALYFVVNVVEKPYFNGSGPNTGPFVWSDESDWPIRFTNSSGEDTSFDRFEVTTGSPVPLPAAIYLLGSVLGALGCCRRRQPAT